MNDKLSSVIIFWRSVHRRTSYVGFFKTKYEKIADEEIASVKETFEHREHSPDKNYKVEESLKGNDAYINIIDSNSYRNYSNTAIETDKKGGTADMELKQPYVITPEQYEDNVDYTKVSLTWYNDEVLEDDWGNVLDPDDVIGRDALKPLANMKRQCICQR